MQNLLQWQQFKLRLFESTEGKQFFILEIIVKQQKRDMGIIQWDVSGRINQMLFSNHHQLTIN